MKSKFLIRIFANKGTCIAVRVCRNYDQVLMETGELSGNTSVTENGLALNVDEVFKVIGFCV